MDPVHFANQGYGPGLACVSLVPIQSGILRLREIVLAVSHFLGTDQPFSSFADRLLLSSLYLHPDGWIVERYILPVLIDNVDKSRNLDFSYISPFVSDIRNKRVASVIDRALHQPHSSQVAIHIHYP